MSVVIVTPPPVHGLPRVKSEHPYRVEMRRWALSWRGDRRAAPDDAAYALIQAVTYRGLYTNMVERRAGA